MFQLTFLNGNKISIAIMFQLFVSSATSHEKFAFDTQQRLV
jgi:hypothetical protein